MASANSRSLTGVGSATLLSVAALTIMVGCVIVPGLPAIAGNLNIGVSPGWLVTVPSLGVVLFGPMAAKLMERLGLRRALLLGLFLYGLLGSAGVALSGTWVVLADRLLLGGATALIMAGGTGLISEFYSGHARMQMIAKQGMSIELGGVIFLFIGGILATISWQWPFALYLVAWVLFAMVTLAVPEVPEREGAQESSEPMAGLSADLKRTYVVAVISMIIFFTAVIVLPAKLGSIGYNEAETGYFLSFVSLVAVGGAAVLPRLSRSLSEQKLLALAMLSYAVGHLLFAVASTTPLLVLGAVFIGVGFGLSVPLVNHATIEHSPDRARSRNLAYLSMAIFSGQFLSAFMELIPGDPARVFGAASSMAVACSIGLILNNRGGEQALR